MWGQARVVLMAAVAVLAVSSGSSALAQDPELFRFDDIPAGLDVPALAELSPAAIDARLVRVDVEALIAGGPVSMPLSDGLRFRAVRAVIERRAGQRVAWRADLDDDGTVRGQATLTVQDGAVAGLLTTPFGNFELVPRGDGISVLVRLDDSLFPEEHPPAHREGVIVQDAGDGLPEVADVAEPDREDSPPNGAARGGRLESGDVADADAAAYDDFGAPPVDILVVYTPAARAAAGGTTNIQTTVQNAVDVSNTAYANSGITQRMNLVHQQEIAFTETGSLDDALAWVDSNATVASLRNTYGADVVQLVVENGGGYCGLAYVMRTVSSGFESSAFGTTARTCAVGNLSFAHEVGHNMGAEHDPANGVLPADASYPYSFGHFVNGVFRTVMSYSSECTLGCTRVAYFSNPSVSYSGYLTGIANQRDNARTLRNTDTTVAAFRTRTPAQPSLVSPTGTTTDPTPTYRWNAVWSASWYRLYVNDSTGNRIAQWYTATDCGCSSGLGQCSLTPSVTIADGNATWWIMAYNGSYGPWSSPMGFTVLGEPVLLSPSGTITDTTPTYRWNPVPTATWYNLYVNDATGNRINTWYTATTLGCSGGTGTCTLTPTTVLNNGSGTWWVRAYNGAYGLWSPSKSILVFGPPTLLAPSGSIADSTPTYRWTAVPTATWYNLYVNDANGNRIFKWYTAAAAGCPAGIGNCQITPSTALVNGTSRFWVQAYNGVYGLWTSMGFTETGGLVGFREHFLGAANGWSGQSGTWTVSSSEYYYTSGAADLSSSATYRTSYANVDYTARMWRYGTLDRSNRIWVRASGTPNSSGIYPNGYMFQYLKSGEYSVYKVVGGVMTTIQRWTASSAIAKGDAWNTLRVIGSGTSLRYYINGVLVWSGTDSSLKAGLVGVGMYRASGSTGDSLYVDYALQYYSAADIDLSEQPAIGLPGMPADYNGVPLVP